MCVCVVYVFVCVCVCACACVCGMPWNCKGIFSLQLYLNMNLLHMLPSLCFFSKHILLKLGEKGQYTPSPPLPSFCTLVCTLKWYKLQSRHFLKIIWQFFLCSDPTLPLVSRSRPFPFYCGGKGSGPHRASHSGLHGGGGGGGG